MAKKDNRRKALYVNSAVQGRLLLRFGAYWAVYHLVLWHAMFLYRYFEYQGSLMPFVQDGGVTMGAPAMPFTELYGQFVDQHRSLIVCSLVVLPFLLWDFLKLTHHVAGPLVRFENVLRRLTAGENIRDVQLRDGDLLTEFRDRFNEFLSSKRMRKLMAESSESDSEARDAEPESTTADSRPSPALQSSAQTTSDAVDAELSPDSRPPAGNDPEYALLDEVDALRQQLRPMTTPASGAEQTRDEG